MHIKVGKCQKNESTEKQMEITEKQMSQEEMKEPPKKRHRTEAMKDNSSVASQSTVRPMVPMLHEVVTNNESKFDPMLAK